MNISESEWNSADKIFPQLEGRWSFKREVVGQANMVGTALFEYEDRGFLLYEEVGDLVLLDGQKLSASRKYYYGIEYDGFTVYFHENPLRVFQRIHLSEYGEILKGSSIHNCGKDLYDTRYEFLPDGSFLVEHRVVGPKKDYTMLSSFARLYS